MPTVCRRRPSRGSRMSSGDRKSTRLNSSHSQISYAVFCLKKKKSCVEWLSYPLFELCDRFSGGSVDMAFTHSCRFRGDDLILTSRDFSHTPQVSYASCKF